MLPDDPQKYAVGEKLMRLALRYFGYDIRFHKPNPSVKSPVLMVSRSDNAFLFSSYCPSTTVELLMRFPLGAPILMGYETELKDGFARYRLPRAEHRECRVFVQQQQGIVGCREIPPVSYQMRRRIMVHGLQNATVRFFAERYCEDKAEAVLNSHYDNFFVGDPLECELKRDKNGCYYEARNVTGDLVFSMPFHREISGKDTD